MPVRIFVSQYRADPGQNVDPVTEWLGANLTSAQIFECRSIWPQRAINTGRPVKQMVVTIAYGTVAIEQAATLQGTFMAPAMSGDTLYSSVKTPVKNAINSGLTTYGIPTNILDSVITWKEALAAIMSEVANDPKAGEYFMSMLDSELA